MFLVRLVCSGLFAQGMWCRSAELLTSPFEESVTALLGMTTVLSASADGTGPFSYQWRKDGVVIPEATDIQLILPDVSFSVAGVYNVVVSNAFGSAVSENSVLLVIVDPNGRLTNVSIRSTVGSGIDALIVAFAVEGIAPKTLIIRGSVPLLVPYGASDSLKDPILSIYSGEKLEWFDDAWSNNRVIIDHTTVNDRVRAATSTFGSLDAALLSKLGSGSKTAILSTSHQGTGIAQLELYEDDPKSTTQLVNVSARLLVDGPGRASTIEFVITGSRSREILLRAIGPGLETFGINGFLADPQIMLFRTGIEVPFARNDDWEGTTPLMDAFSAVGAFPVPSDSRDAALRTFLPPGTYTAQISSTDRSTGIALVELFAMR